jgi:hypothetical protein
MGSKHLDPIDDEDVMRSNFIGIAAENNLL